MLEEDMCRVSLDNLGSLQDLDDSVSISNSALSHSSLLASPMLLDDIMSQLKQKPDALGMNKRTTTKSENLSEQMEEKAKLSKIDESILQVLYQKPEGKI